MLSWLQFVNTLNRYWVALQGRTVSALRQSQSEDDELASLFSFLGKL